MLQICSATVRGDDSIRLILRFDSVWKSLNFSAVTGAGPGGLRFMRFFSMSACSGKTTGSASQVCTMDTRTSLCRRPCLSHHFLTMVAIWSFVFKGVSVYLCSKELSNRFFFIMMMHACMQRGESL